MQQSIVKFYCFVVQTLLNMFRALQCPSSGARQTSLAASGFRMNVEVKVFSAVQGLLVDTMPIIRSPSNCPCSLWFPYECGGGQFVSNKPTAAENTSTSTFIRKPEAASAV